MNSYKDIFSQAKEDRLQSATEVPYFDGDFWPDKLEVLIDEVNRKELERKQAEAEEV